MPMAIAPFSGLGEQWEWDDKVLRSRTGGMASAMEWDEESQTFRRWSGGLQGSYTWDESIGSLRSFGGDHWDWHGDILQPRSSCGKSWHLSGTSLFPLAGNASEGWTCDDVLPKSVWAVFVAACAPELCAGSESGDPASGDEPLQELRTPGVKTVERDIKELCCVHLVRMHLAMPVQGRCVICRGEVECDRLGFCCDDCNHFFCADCNLARKQLTNIASHKHHVFSIKCNPKFWTRRPSDGCDNCGAHFNDGCYVCTTCRTAYCGSCPAYEVDQQYHPPNVTEAAFPWKHGFYPYAAPPPEPEPAPVHPRPDPDARANETNTPKGEAETACCILM